MLLLGHSHGNYPNGHSQKDYECECPVHCRSFNGLAFELAVSQQDLLCTVVLMSTQPTVKTSQECNT